jgi:hypothetical protein
LPLWTRFPTTLRRGVKAVLLIYAVARFFSSPESLAQSNKDHNPDLVGELYFGGVALELNCVLVRSFEFPRGRDAYSGLAIYCVEVTKLQVPAHSRTAPQYTSG